MATTVTVRSHAAGNTHCAKETRPGQYFPIGEADGGTYILNARDMRLADHIPELLHAGIDSLKIERPCKIRLLYGCRNKCLPAARLTTHWLAIR